MPGPKVTIDRGKLDDDTEALISDILKAGTRAVGAATRRLEKSFETATRTAVPGDKAWRAWASKVYPRGGKAAYEPVGEVFGKGGARTQGLLSWWTTQGTVRAKRGRFLAVPLRAALGTYRRGNITPRNWEGIFRVKLRPWFRPGKTALLVADGYVDGRGHFIPKKSGAAKQRGGQNVKRSGTVPVFALIEEQAHGNKVSLARAIDDAHSYLEETYDRRLARIGRR